MRIFGSGVAFAIFAGAPSASLAQFAPEGAIPDIGNSSAATKTTTDPNNLTKIVDHYYYDCLRKKWVWVSREWFRAPKGFESGEWTLVPTPPEYTFPDTKVRSPGPPPGAATEAGDPNRSYNPTTGQNFVKEKDGSWIDVKTGKKVEAPKLCPPCPEPATSTTPQPPPPKTPKGAENTICPEKKRTAMVQPLNPFDKRMLDVHNAERAAVGAPPLQWNPTLAADAAGWAQQLARIGQLVHAPREGRGIERENLSQGLIGWGPDQLLRNWIDEKRDFFPGDFPNVARDGNWLNVAHYTQMIWPTTTDLGCGMAAGRGFEWLVCRYSPGGNKDGKPVGEPVQIAQAPCVEPRSAGTERG